MRLLYWGLLWLSAPLAWAIDPADPRLHTVTGPSFVRFCSSMLGHSPYQISLEDPRVDTLRKFYSHLNRGRLRKAMDLYAEDSVYRLASSVYVGKLAIEEQLISAAEDGVGEFRILDVSWKNNQLFAFVGFEGTLNGIPISVEYLEIWVLNRSGKIYYRQTWSRAQTR